MLEHEWIFTESADGGPPDEAALFLSKNTGLGRLAATVCVNRGISTPDAVKSFLNPRLDSLTHPFKIRDMQEAATAILASQQGPEAARLRVFTDYDVDGTTGAALLTWFFRDLGFRFDVVQPDRFRDGYGLQVRAVEDAHRDGIDILITVDCGITSFDAAEKARELGIRLIIVDHHQIDPVKGLPAAFACVDPQRSDDESGLKQLCGCALAFYLCMGIRMLGRDSGFFVARGIPEPNLKSLLDLVVIATAADMVPLIGDNRTLVKHGLDVLRNTEKPGLRELMKVAGIEVKNVGPSNLGFALGPRINASGRMGSAETAYRVLTTKDPDEGRRLALELEGVNTERAELQNRIWDEVRARVEQGLEKGLFSHSVVVGDPGWHEGVVGIVASKVTEHFHRPAVILAIREDGIAKGSVRSYGGCNILEVLHLSKGHLLGYGGHKYAAGLSLRPDGIDDFAADFNRSVASQVPDKRKHPIRIESYCELEELDLKALEEIERLAPFGPGHPEPVFAVRAKVEQQSILKGRHVKLRLGSARTRGFEGIWFNAAERLDDTLLMEKSAQNGKPCEFAGIPEINRFLGKTSPTLRIKSARAVE